MEDLVREWLKHWMPSQQAWTMVPELSWNAALTYAVIELDDRAREEKQQAAALAA
jgi:hypothetical protein